MHKMIDSCAMSHTPQSIQFTQSSILTLWWTTFLYSKHWLCTKISSYWTLLTKFRTKKNKSNETHFLSSFFVSRRHCLCSLATCVISGCCQKYICSVQNERLTQLSAEFAEHFSKCLWLLNHRNETRRLMSGSECDRIRTDEMKRNPEWCDGIDTFQTVSEMCACAADKAAQTSCACNEVAYCFLGRWNIPRKLINSCHLNE